MVLQTVVEWTHTSSLTPAIRSSEQALGKRRVPVASPSVDLVEVTWREQHAVANGNFRSYRPDIRS